MQEENKLGENTRKCKSASTVLMKTIDECPFQDLFDSKKLGIMKSRVDQTLKLVDKEPLPKPAIPGKRPVLKQQYSFKSKFGTKGSGNGQLSNPYGIAIEPSTGNIYIADTGNTEYKHSSVMEHLFELLDHLDLEMYNLALHLD
jgi:hypothetical protein